MNEATARQLNPAVKQLFESWRPKVIFWDMWMTLGMSHCREPIGLAQEIFVPGLTRNLIHGLPDPTGDFLRYCLTNPTADPRAFCEEAGVQFGFDVTDAGVDAFSRILRTEQNCIALFPDVEETLEFCKRGSYEQGIISNLWAFPAERLFSDTVLRRYFSRNEIVCSFEVRHAKPEREIFEEACRRFGVRPEDCLMIGDNLTADIKGALDFGMKAALIDRQEKVDPGHLVDMANDGYPPIMYLSDLRELIGYLSLCPMERAWR